MPKARTEGLPQHNMDSAHYGAMSIEHMPDATQTGDMMYWDGVQWVFIRIVGGGRLDVSYDVHNGTVELFLAEDRVYFDFLADAALLATYAYNATGDSVLLGTIADDFTADAELV